jgi:hypothetical protein
MAGNQKAQPMKTILILSVAVGGAIGSVARYLVAIGSARAFGLAGCILSDRAWRERGRGALYDRLGVAALIGTMHLVRAVS